METKALGILKIIMNQKILSRGILRKFKSLVYKEGWGKLSSSSNTYTPLFRSYLKGSIRFLNLSICGLLFSSFLISCSPNNFQNNTSETNAFSESEDGITNGSTVNENDPIGKSTVAIYYSQMIICTGSYLGNRAIITAAHCLTPGSRVSDYGVIFGTDLKQMGLGRRVKAVKIHEKYLRANKQKKLTINGQQITVETDNNDLALLILDGEAPTFAVPSKIVSNIKNLMSGRRVIVAGFGTQGIGALDEVGKMFKVDVVIKDSKFSMTEVLLDQSRGKGACKGDSGGPAFIIENGMPSLFGVTSRGVGVMPANGCPTLAAYTNILAHQQWVNENLQKLAQITK